MVKSSNRDTVYDSDFGSKYSVENSGTLKRIVEEKKSEPGGLAAAAVVGAGIAATAGVVAAAPLIAAAAAFVGVRYGLSKLFKD